MCLPAATLYGTRCEGQVTELCGKVCVCQHHTLAPAVKVKLRSCAKCVFASTTLCGTRCEGQVTELCKVCVCQQPHSVVSAANVKLRSCAKCSLASTRCEGEVTLWHHAAERRLLHAAAAAEVWQRPATGPGYRSGWVLIAHCGIACRRAGHRFPGGPLRSSGTTVFTTSL